jgi:hypothetical protein
LINGCFHNRPVMCPRSLIMAQEVCIGPRQRRGLICIPVKGTILIYCRYKKKIPDTLLKCCEPRCSGWLRIRTYMNNGLSWLIKVLRKGCFHNGPVMCPRSVIMALEVSVLSLGVASGHYYRPWAHNRAIMKTPIY